jgi:peptidoglycan/xylan/chitin deacetylase (PgdA/CDA1 family)
MVISLDFELHWGVRDWMPVNGRYRSNLLGARSAVPRLLEIFQEFEVAATWATVGLLFAATRAEAKHFAPVRKPRYLDRTLWPYAEPVGDDEAEDPLHYARSLIQLIKVTPRQEIASHTFSHYYCLEPGQQADDFRADLESAIAIAEHCGIRLRTVVFPRNQVNPAYAPILREAGFSAYRGNQAGEAYRAVPGDALDGRMRVRRLLDAYVDLDRASPVACADLLDADGLVNVRASRFLRPFKPLLASIESRRLRRICGGLDEAARSGGIFHLWWHPHNFGAHLTENLRSLRHILEHFSRLRRTEGFMSLNMADVAEQVAAGHH